MSAPASIKIELQRGDLTGKHMNIIVNYFEVPPGATVGRHTHPGEEVVYVIEGGTLEDADGTMHTFKAGSAMIYPRGVPHAGVKVVGDKALKMLNVFIVDKDKPVTELV